MFNHMPSLSLDLRFHLPGKLPAGAVAVGAVAVAVAAVATDGGALCGTLARLLVLGAPRRQLLNTQKQNTRESEHRSSVE